MSAKLRAASASAVVLVHVACAAPAPAPASAPPRATAAPTATVAAPPAVPLRPVSDFASIQDPSARSVALFTEAARVITHPRCLNCHPADRVPTQGDDLHAHVPPMQGGARDHGPAGLACNACHSAGNVKTYGETIATIPGHPHWSLAPLSMAWQGKSLGEICAQIKDPARNGNRSLPTIREHMAEDTLVGWAWHPGEGRTPAPGTQKEFGQLIEAWIATGAACPKG